MPLKPKTLIAHRGGVVDAHRSENSFKALNEAIHREYTHIEIDARITADGHVVCFHNDTLQEEAGIDGTISEMPLEAITKTVLTRSGETIPSFYDYCAQCADRIGVMIDLKGCPDTFIEAYAQEIETALADHDLLDDALILINQTPENNQAQIANLFLKKSRISWRKSLEETRTVAQQDPEFISNYYVCNHGDDFSAEEVTGFQEMGLEVIVSINTGHYKTGNAQQQGEDHIKKMLQHGVDGLQIDSCFDSLIF